MILRRPVPSVADFAAWLVSVPGGSLLPMSVVAYEREFREFVAFAGRPLRKGYSRSQVESWLGTRNVSASTATRALSALRKGFEFMGQPDATQGIRRPKRDKGLPQPVEGLPFLLKQMQDDGERDLMFVCVFLASTGLRVSEACGENGCSFELVEDGEAIRVQGKGSKTRIVPLDEAAKTALHMLTPPTGQVRIPFTVKQLQNATRPYGFHPHQLRHFAASRWYEDSGDVLAVSVLLGHASVATTQVYSKVSSKRLRAAVNGGDK